MIIQFKIDKSGRDLFEKDYSVVLVKDDEEVYGVNIPQKIKDRITHEFLKGSLWQKNILLSEKTNKMRLRIRFHTSVIISLLKKAIYDMGGSIDKISILICNDFDGHFQEMKDMIYDHLSKLIPSFEKDNIILAKFPKPNFVDTCAKNIREKNKKETNLYNLVKLDEEELINLIKR
jgi:hypothetical protein